MKNLKLNYNNNFIIASVTIIILIFFPFIIPNDYIQHLLILSMIYAIVASNWDLTIGYFGLFNFSHIGVFVLGAYTAGILSKTYGVSPWISIIVASLFSVIISSFFALPMLRVKGLYVCLITFGFSQLCFHFVLSQRSLTGGCNGLTLIPSICIGGYSFVQNGRIAYYFLTLLLLVISTFFLNRIVNSSFGLSIVALRDYEEYAVSRGVNFGHQLILTFAASSFFTGAAGAIMAFYLTALSPEMFGFDALVIVLCMVLVGGISTIYGSLVGALILTIISEPLVTIGPWRQIIIGSLIIFILRFYPHGAWPSILKFSKNFKIIK
jgi:branched-chain amino acid transport system permease protein